jgi:hypothetical protein
LPEPPYHVPEDFVAEVDDDEEISLGRRVAMVIRDGVLILLAATIVFGLLSGLLSSWMFRDFDW